MLKDRLFGLIGKNISYSFSKKYFTEKFHNEKILKARYELFDLPDIENFIPLLARYPDLSGLNVTIPYKEDIVPYLTELKAQAREIGAVNTIKIRGDERIGYNTDIYGFEKSFTKYLLPKHKQALVLGRGGAAKAVGFVLKKMGIPFQPVSRDEKKVHLSYSSLDKSILEKYQIIINCTPLGTYPYTDQCPLLPYQYLGTQHYLYDLVYNPLESLFLKIGKSQGALTQNGLQMLHLQAERAWEIWNARE
ncbi:shikimate dehydrogenase family protein [Bacteroidetes bacterium endosymbiont of Geopemphigus sp.]|uniref:shikimate dehydrogenase family protein n=1 Tax=Bacteroidetes bacterium endosymbiont of Geopemphigus sp. TaxID=2047937 RepID=UPI000CD32141|nr:shikimate dehydrogenase [Bacteroidetes bacterium endosymbiont of Geopemphigus sp.]